MKLERFCDVAPNATALVCRQGRLCGVLTAIIFSVILIGMPVVFWLVLKLWLLAIPFTFLALLVVPLMISDMRSRFRTSNWIMSIEESQVLINLRSYKDKSAADTLSVVKLNYSEIAEVSKHVERFLTPTTKGTRANKTQSLEIRLNHSETEELAKAIKSNRRNKQPEKTYFGFITVSGGQMPANVTLEQPDTLRILWRDQFNWTVPSFRRVFAELSHRVIIAEPTLQSLGNILAMSEGEFNNKVLDLICSGDRIGATTLLKKRRGFSTTEAHNFVNNLAEHV